MFTVIVTEKGGARQNLEFDDEIVSIGRVQGNEIVLPRGNVSKRHAKVEYRGGQFFISDAGSTNGTYMNGRRVLKPTIISNEDKIYIGDYIVSLSGHESLEPEDIPEEITPDEFEDVENIENIEDVEEVEEDSSSVQVISFLDNPEPALEEAEEPGPHKPKITVPRRRKEKANRGPSMSLVPEKKVGKGSEAPSDMAKLYTLVESILDKVAREIKRVDRTRAPMKLDAGIAGQVRIVVEDTVNRMVSRGKVSEEIDVDLLRAKAFRSIVDLGPLSAWLDDPDVKLIRISQPTSAFLLKDGEWMDAPGDFLSLEDMASAVRCLGAGLTASEGNASSVSWYRLEEGYRVFAATGSSGSARPSLFVDKTAAPSMEKAKAALPKVAASLIEDALKKRENIAIIGDSVSSRMSVLETIVELLPSEEFVALVEKLTFRAGDSERRHVIAVPRNPDGTSHSSTAILSHALATETDWVVLGGAEASDTLEILRIAAGRRGVLSDLPIGSADHLELAATACMGGTIPRRDAADLLVKAFDKVAVVGRDPKGYATVKAFLKVVVSSSGKWLPKTLFEVGGK